MTDQTSELLYMRAKLRLPGGVNSPVRAYQAVGRTPRFIQSAKGSHITDVDGNEMIDYVCSWGPGILGHADPRVIEKVKAACEEGLTFGAPTEREVEMAELLAQLVPSMEVSRLVSSGTEKSASGEPASGFENATGNGRSAQAGQSGCGKTGRDRRSGSDAAAVAKLGTFTCVSGRKNETA